MRYFDFLDLATPADQLTLELIGSDWGNSVENKVDCDLLFLITAHAGDLDIAKKNAKLIRKLISVNKFLNVDVKILVGDLSQSTAFFHKDEIIYLNCSDYYEGLPEKVLSGMNAIFNSFDFKWVLKIDAGMTPNDMNGLIDLVKLNFDETSPRGYGFIREKRFEIDRAWHKGKCHDQELNLQDATENFPRMWLDGGRGYLLNQNAVFLIIKELFESAPRYNYRNAIYEDVLLGMIAEDLIPLGNADFSKFFYDATNPLNLRR